MKIGLNYSLLRQLFEGLNFSSKDLKSMILLTFTLFGILLSIDSQAQVPDPNIISYDMVYLKNGKVLKGEIIIFEEKDGDITFKDTMGRKYSITREEYNYFVEDVRTYVSLTDTLIINPRKENELELSLGFRTGLINVQDDFIADDYYLNTTESQSFLPVNLKLGLGKYIDRENFIGLSVEVGLASEIKGVINAGLRYTHQYDAYRKNVAFYIPIEIQYSHMQFNNFYSVNDTIFNPSGIGWETPLDLEVVNTINALTISAGQGFSFIRSDKKSIGVELIIFKSFIMTYESNNSYPEKPKSEFLINGVKLSLLYNL